MNLHPSTSLDGAKPRAVFLAISVLCAALVATSAPVAAQPVGPGDGYSVSTQDNNTSVAPGRAGRLSDVTGQVWLSNPEQREWVTAERNRPLTSGDRLATDRSAHAEVRVGSTVVRLDVDTELEVLRLDDDHLHLQLHRGASQVQLRDGELAQQFELVTAEGRFHTDRPGTYRFDRIGSRTQATALNGQLFYDGQQQALTIQSGQRAEFLFDGNGRAQYAVIEPKRDAFASWNNERDRVSREASISQRYVSPEMTGAEELDGYGRWEEDPEYGPLWMPSGVAPGWAPYTTGRWAWVQPWGWTWVDVSPWGFAPFHYGRWVQRGPFWAWSPGRYVARPVYAPALVGWVGGPPVYRPGVSIDISIGGGGRRNWYPLSPRDRYEPTYRSHSHHEREWSRPSVSNRDHWRNRDDRPSYSQPRPRIDRSEPDRGANLPPRFEGRPDDARPEHRSDRRRDGNEAPPPAAPFTAPPLDQPGRRDRERDVRPAAPPAAPAVVPAPAPIPAPTPAVRPDDRRGRMNEEVRQQVERSVGGRYGGGARNAEGDRPDRQGRDGRDNNRGDRPDPRNGN